MPNLKKLSILLIFWIISYSSESQNPKALGFGTDSTLEVITWNLEQFPKEGQVTIDYVTNIINALDVDVIALQEIGDLTLFNQMVQNLDGYAGYAVPGSYTDLAYIYKTSTVEINRIYEIYTASSYWAPFPRPPLVLDFKYKNLNFIVLNNHLKCCGDGVMDTGDPEDEETRRYRACILLRQYIDEYFPDNRVFIVGDMNDELTDNVSDNVFQIIINDDENYLFADTDIANGNSNNWSYPNWPSHLDHIAITGELFPAFENQGSEIMTIKAEQGVSGGWNVYENNVSDHRPVGIKLLLPGGLGIENPGGNESGLSCFPNPLLESTTIAIPPFNGTAVIYILNAQGRLVYTETLKQGQTSITWNTNGISCGLYSAHLIIDGKATVAAKLVVIR